MHKPHARKRAQKRKSPGLRTPKALSSRSSKYPSASWWMIDGDDVGDLHRSLRFPTRREIIFGADGGQETRSVELEHDFAEMLTRLHHAMGARSVGSGQHLVNRRPQATGFQSRAELLEECGNDPCLLRRRPRAQRRSVDSEVTPKEHREIDLRARTAHQTDQHQSSALRERFDIAGEVGAADAVEDRVDAATLCRGFHRRRKRAALIVDRDLGAELAALLALLVR